MAIGGGGIDRDAFLLRALAAGACEALWVDGTLGWAERYGAPTPPRRGRRFTRRDLVWPGEVILLPGPGER